jgi:uncharacterized membrane protein (UPF0127 family)
MRVGRYISLLVTGAILWSGCRKPEGGSALVPLADEEVATKPQGKLSTMKLWLGAQEMITELALNNRERMTGMMFRESMAENEGMLFVFPYPHRTGFWMKNTILALSAAYIDPDGVILEIHDLKPQDTNAVDAASSRIQYVLETRQGWFQRNKVGIGTVIRTERGSLAETFFGRR